MRLVSAPQGEMWPAPVNARPQVDVLSLFDRSGVMVEPWRAAGFSTLTVDIGEARHDGPHLQTDILSAALPSCSVLFAFPPCTHLAGSGARWWEAKGPAALAESMALVRVAIEAAKGARWWLLENPVGRLSTEWRPANWTFDPCEFAGWSATPDADAYTKRTCVWGNVPKPTARPVPPVLGSKMHLIPPGPDRQYLRSLTPAGFAAAVFASLTEPKPGA